jgi:DDE superfamily endonuclease
VVGRVRRAEEADPAAVCAFRCGGFGGCLAGWPAGAGAAENGPDAARAGRRSGALTAAGGLGRSRWEADALRDLVRDYTVETLAAPDAVLVLGETGFLKQGSASCGVKRQYTGSAGKITNCQIGVFAAYVSD